MERGTHSDDKDRPNDGKAEAAFMVMTVCGIHIEGQIRNQLLPMELFLRLARLYVQRL